MSRRSLARVVFPLEEHPLMPMMMVRVSSMVARKVDLVVYALDVSKSVRNPC
jgi:hypothetical protein